MSNQTLLKLTNINKTFPPSNHANKDICLEVAKGEVLALLGENGAGKSTLMNILYGILQPDNGCIHLNGKECAIKNPKHAIAHGIGMVHQHFMLVKPITVVENIILATDDDHKIMMDTKQVADNVLALSEKYHLQVDPYAKVQDLTVGQQQRVEIIKALYKECDLLVLDEPTAVLTPQETEELFLVIDQLIKSGKSVIFISHKLNEVMRISNRVTVLRGGKVVGTVQTAETDKQQLAELMVGKKVLLQVEKEEKEAGDVVLSVKDLQVKGATGSMAVKGLSLDVRAGEIYGLAGVDGNGQSELIKSIMALLPKVGGTVHICGEDASQYSSRKVLDIGVGHIPEDRHGFGVIMDMSIKQNMMMHIYRQEEFCKHGFMNWNKITDYANRLVEEYDVRPPNSEAVFSSLSGGNQQKVVVARELDKKPSLLIAMHPTRGVDVGSIEFIHKQIVKARDAGQAVLLVSTELEEVMSLSDRIGVVFAGKIMGELDAKTATVEQIGLLMAGSKSKENVAASS